MAILTGATITIPEAQLKVRWRETYASEGLNKALCVPIRKRTA